MYMMGHDSKVRGDSVPAAIAPRVARRHLARVGSVVVVGLAYDFCVKYTALDAKKLGYDVCIIRECCRGVNMPGPMDSAEKELAAAGVRVVESLADVSSSF